MSKIDADTFIKIWREFSNDFVLKNKNWITLYHNDRAWSEKLLGGRKSSSSNSFIGEFFKGKFPELRYRTEDGSFDLAFSFAPNYTQLSYLNRNKIETWDIECFKSFYPTKYDVLIEIENNYKCAWQEMTKLTWVRSPLKVLITYNWRPSDTSMWEKETRIFSTGRRVSLRPPHWVKSSTGRRVSLRPPIG